MSRIAKKDVDAIYEENAEASPKKGVQRKGGKPPPTGSVKVVHKKAGMDLKLLDKVQLLYITSTGLVGEYMIFTEFSDPWRHDAMWAFGIAMAVSAIPCLFRKRE